MYTCISHALTWFSPYGDAMSLGAILRLHLGNERAQGVDAPALPGDRVLRVGAHGVGHRGGVAVDPVLVIHVMAVGALVSWGVRNKGPQRHDPGKGSATAALLRHDVLVSWKMAVK